MEMSDIRVTTKLIFYMYGLIGL